jgi:hypothetical protein
LEHEHAIHLLPNPDVPYSSDFSGYGSHVLVVVPSRVVWGEEQDGQQCWHTDGCFPLICLTCENIQLDALSLPEFQKEMGMNHLELPAGLSAVLYNPLSGNLVPTSAQYLN